MSSKHSPSSLLHMSPTATCRCSKALSGNKQASNHDSVDAQEWRAADSVYFL